MSFTSRQRQFKGRYRGGYARARGVGYKKSAMIKSRRRAALGRFRPGADRVGGYYGRYSNGGELKFHDVDLDDAVVSQAATVTDSINKIPQGITEKTRIGRKCTIKSILWRYNLRLPATSTTGDTSDTVRVILYLDKQCNGATIADTDLLESDDFQSFNNLANSGRFRVLMDRNHTMASPSGLGNGTTNFFGENREDFTFFKKCNIPIEFNNTTGAITEIRSNNIGVILVSESGLVQFGSKIRLRFSDN